MTDNKKYRVWLGIALRYLIGIFIILWLWKADLIDPAILKRINLQTALIGATLVFIQVFLAGWRAKILLTEHNISVGVWRCISYNSVGIFYSLFLPGGMSGDLARAYCFWRAYPEVSKSALFGALFVDRLLGTVAMIFMGLIAGTMLMSTLGLQKFVLASWLIFIITGMCYFFVVRLHLNGDKDNNSLAHRMLRFLEKIDLKTYRLKVIGISSVISLVGHICAVLIIYMFSSLMNSGLDLLKIITVAPLGLLANALPLTPGGLGIGEKGFDLLYKMIGGSQGGNSFLLARVFLFLPAMLGAAVVVYQFFLSHRQLNMSWKVDK